MRLKIEPYDYQLRGIEFAFTKRYSLNGDRMGLGKSLQALGLVTLAGANRVLVVCPAFLTFNWRNEIEKFLGAEHQDKFDVMSYDAMTKLKTIAPYDVVVVDEIHYLKNLQAQRTKTFHALMEKSQPKYFIGLSGTPIKNSVPEFYSLLKLCWLGGGYPAFDVYSKGPYGFLAKFTVKKTLFLGGRQITKYDGVRNVEGLKELIKPVYLRRRTEDVLSLPQQVFQEVLISDKSVFDEKVQAAWDSYLGGKNRNLFTSNKAVSALAKVSFTVEFVRGLLQEVDRVIVFSDHVQAVKEIFTAFDVGDSRYITGETPMAARAGIVKEFEVGKCKVLVATIGAMSVGVNLTSCSTMVFNDAPWVPADMAQAEARIWRIGQTRKVAYYYILASKTDQVIYRTLASKKKLIERVGT